MLRSTLGTAAIALLAGYVGSALPDLFLPRAVHAQVAKIAPFPGTENQISKAIRAERFILTDEQGNTRAELKVEKGSGQIVFYGSNGEVTWKGPVGPHIVR